jgi:hypothetical protein
MSLLRQWAATALLASSIAGVPARQAGALGRAAPYIEIWHGDTQRVGNLGDAQDDFNLMGRVEPWREVDRLHYQINGAATHPLSFRAFRRLVADGDFNADIPIGLLKPGPNTVTVIATFGDGATLRKSVTLHRQTGARPLPVVLRWKELAHFQEGGQAVDGHWEITRQGLRTRQVGYDRVFLIGERTWKDYDVRTTVTIHRLAKETTPISGGNGLGMILRFAGHVTGGPRYFPSGQPRWGYQPFGSIGWLRWRKGSVADGPDAQFYPGLGDRWENKKRFAAREGGVYGMRYACQTLPDAPDGSGVTRYSYKVWDAFGPEPHQWTWQQTQTSRHALRRGGAALLAHHVDVTFGDVEIRPASSFPRRQNKRR